MHICNRGVWQRYKSSTKYKRIISNLNTYYLSLYKVVKPFTGSNLICRHGLFHRIQQKYYSFLQCCLKRINSLHYSLVNQYPFYVEIVCEANEDTKGHLTHFK